MKMFEAGYLGSLLYWLRIPLKAIRIPEPSRSLFRKETDQASERSDAGTSMLPRLIGIVKQNLSGAKRRRNATSRERGAGKGAAALCPASAHSNRERELRSESGQPTIRVRNEILRSRTWCDS